jgi:hypothetical protein
VVIGTSTEFGLVEQRLDFLEPLQHVLPVLLELGAAWIESGSEGWSEQCGLHGFPV